MESSKRELRFLALLAVFTGTIALSLILANGLVSMAENGSPAIALSEPASDPQYQMIRAGDTADARPTGRTVTLLLTSDGGDPIPNDAPFGMNVRVWDDPSAQSKPNMIVDSTGATYIAFQHFNGADWDVYITVSVDDGYTWATPVALANTTANETNPSLAVTSTGAFALFYQQDALTDQMLFFHSTDGILWRQGSWSLSVKPGLSNAQFPSVMAQNPPGAYPDGIMVITQVRCDHPTNCIGGSDTAYWVGSSSWSTWPPAFNLANWYWGNPGGNPPQLQHPCIAWSDTRLYQVMENVTVAGTQWQLTISIHGADGTFFFSRHFSQANSTANIHPFIAANSSGFFATASFVNATLFPSNPTNHNILYYYSADLGSNINVGVLDTSATDQRSTSIVGRGSEWHITYYSDSVMTHQVSYDSGSSFSGPQKVSDNAGTAVNDDRATSVRLGNDGIPRVAWQDDRDGDLNIYVASNFTYTYWINATCGGTDVNLDIRIDGVDRQTPIKGSWSPGSVHTVEVAQQEQIVNSCKKCNFSQWSTGGQSPLLITVTDNVTILAEFNDKYLVQLATIPPLPLLNITWDGMTYQGLTSLFEFPGNYLAIVPEPQLTAPDIRYDFIQWSDGGTSTMKLVAVPGPGLGCVNLTAIFQAEYIIKVVSNPTGLFVGYDGVFGNSSLSFWAVEGTTHTLNTSSPQPDIGGDPGLRYRFSNWTNGPSTLNWTIVVNNPATYTADFVKQFRITIRSNIPGPLFNVTGADCGVTLPAPGPLVCWADQGTNPTIEAISPPPGPCRLVFSVWSDGYPLPVRSAVPVPPNATYIAMFELQCPLTISIDPVSCWDAGPPTITWYRTGETVALSWSPPPGLPPYERYRFKEWLGTGDGNYSGPDPTVNVTILDAITETAYCYHEFQLSIDTVPPSVIFYYVDDVNYSGLQSFWWLNRSTHWLNVTMTTQMGATAGTRYVFVEWSGVDISSLPHHPPIVVSSSTVGMYYVNFKTQHLLTLLPLDKGNARCVENADCWYNASTSATINVTTPWSSGEPYIRYAFQYWSGDASGTDSTIVISSVDSPMTIIANWANEYKLTVVTDHSSYSCSPDSQCWFLDGSFANVTLAETIVSGAPGVRYVFDGWTGDATGMNPFPLSMDSSKNITVLWKTQYQLIISSTCGSYTGCGSPIGAGWYNATDSATVVLTTPWTDSTGKVWDFDRWHGDATGTQSTTTLTMDGPKNISALWKEHPTEGPSAIVVWLAILAIVVICVILILLLLKRKRIKTDKDEVQQPEHESPPSNP